MFVYTLPALAFFPQLIRTPQTAFATPILSALIIYAFTSLLMGIQHFNTPWVVSLALGLGALASIRVARMIIKQGMGWSKTQVALYVFHFILLFPYFIKLGTHAFDRGDEIYSWNFWAIQHYFLEPVDFSHTGAPYPQLFPKLLAFCYHLLGNLDLQLPVKGTLIVFPWAMLTAIAMTGRYQFTAWRLTYGIGLFLVLFGIKLGQFFDDGYADPIMSSALVVSVVLFWQSQQKTFGVLSSHTLAGWSVLCAITAAHAKQAGLLWALFALPIMLMLAKMRWLSIVSVLGSLEWVVGEGRHFHKNQGVLGLSLGDRDFISQLGYAVDKYFIHQPLLLGLFLLALFVHWKDKTVRQVVFLFMIPSVLCWFLFGAYQLRLGQHLIALAFWVVVVRGITFPFPLFLQAKAKYLLIATVSTCLLIGGGLFVRYTWEEGERISLYTGGRQSLQRYFGKEAHFIYTTIYSQPNVLLWVPSRYLYGLFYKHTRLITPDYSKGPYDAQVLVKELQSTLPDYVFTVSPAVIDGPASQVLSEVIAQCPHVFEKVADAPNRFDFVTYRVRKDLLSVDPCLSCAPSLSNKLS